MRVLVEMLDKDPINNVLGPCIFAPDVVVYLCDSRDSSFFKESAIFRLFKRRKMKTLPRFLYFDASDPVNIELVLSAVVRDYPQCVFDFSGGKDLVLLVAGTFLARIRVSAFYMDIPRERFINICGCEQLEKDFKLPSFSADDILTMAGATIAGSGHFLPSDTNESFEQAALRVFDIVMHNTKAWGTFVSWLQGFCAGSSPSCLSIEGHRRGKKTNANLSVLNNLKDVGFLRTLSTSNNRISIEFTSALHKKCLLIEGIWLELYAYITAKRSGLFGDVRTSVVIDWDGVEGGKDNTKNEVDALIVCGITPVFISCKMSVPSALALSEIRILASKFGGSNARAVMLTASPLRAHHQALRTRASELSIHLLDGDIIQGGKFLEHLAQLTRPRHQAKDTPRLVDANMLPK